MGDTRRFDMFADLVAHRFASRTVPVADVAGGKGLLQAALRRRGFASVTTWDKRRSGAKGRSGYRYSLFDYRSAPEGYGLVLGMHPDGGTDHIIRYAARHRVPFAVCPCCVLPSAAPYGGPRDYRHWVEHLARLAASGGHRVERVTLKMKGCADVLIGHPTVAA